MRVCSGVLRECRRIMDLGINITDIQTSLFFILSRQTSASSFFIPTPFRAVDSRPLRQEVVSATSADGGFDVLY